MAAKKQLSSTLKIFYGVGDTGFSLMTHVELFLFVFFLTNVARFSLGTVAIIGTVTSIVDAVLSPFYGAIISGTKPMKWGRNRSWMLVAPPLVVLLYIFQYTKIGPTETIQAIVVSAGFILSHIIWNIAWVANVALIPILANNADERALLASRRATWTAVAGIIFSYIGPPLAIYIGDATGNEVLGYSALAGVMAFLMMLGYWAVFKMTKSYELTGEQVAALAAAGVANKVSPGGMLRSFIQNPSLIVLLIADFFRFMGFFILVASAAYYFKYVAQNMDLFPLYLLLGAIGALVGAYLAEPISKILSSRKTVIYFGLLAFVIMVMGRFFGMNVIMFFIFIIAARVLLALLGPAVVAMYSDVAIFSHWKTREDATPFVMGLMTVSLKAAIISRATIIPLMLAIAGFDAAVAPADATPALKQAVIDLNLLIPGIFIAVTAIILAAAYKLSEDKLNNMQNEIDTRVSL